MMRNLLSSKYLTLVFRLSLGAIFIIASLDKIASPGDFASSIRNYRMVPYMLVNIMAIVLPWLEFFCGVLLILGIFIRASSLLISFMLIVFIIAISSAVARGLDIDCGCFKNVAFAGKVGWQRLFEDILMFAMGIHIFLFPNRFLAIEGVFRKNGQFNRESD